MSGSTSKIVVITVRRRSGARGWGRIRRDGVATPPLKGVSPRNYHDIGASAEARARQEIGDALNTIRDDDILVFNAHANQRSFVYGRDNTRVYWTEEGNNPGFWEYFGIKKPPRLTAVIMASCMAPKGQQLPGKRLRELRKAFHARMMVAPHSTYESGGVDRETTESIITRIIQWSKGEISAADLNGRINGDQDRFGVTYGCNGRNHSEWCGCRFGPNWKGTQWKTTNTSPLPPGRQLVH